MLQRLGRVSYRALKRQFALDDAFLEDLKYEITEVQQLAVDHGGTVMVLWPCLGRQSPMKTMPCGPAMPRWPCRRPSAATATRCVASTASKCRSESASTRVRWSYEPSATTCTWTTPPLARPRTWQPV